MINRLTHEIPDTPGSVELPWIEVLRAAHQIQPKSCCRADRTTTEIEEPVKVRVIQILLRMRMSQLISNLSQRASRNPDEVREVGRIETVEAFRNVIRR